MATITFQVGTKVDEPVSCEADLPKLSTHPDDAPIPAVITLPSGEEIKVVLASKKQLMMDAIIVALQAPARKAAFPKDGQAVKTRKTATYTE